MGARRCSMTSSVSGQGTIPQSAALAGCRVVGFDRLPPSRHFGNLPGSGQGSIHFARTHMPNGTH
eukprot:5121224-Pleurochrysis_carterae.AAC.1